MTLNEYQSLAARTINKELSTVKMRHHALYGMVGEIGEIHSIYQKRFQGHEIDTEKVAKELGDLLWMLAEFASSFGWELDCIAQMNIDKLKARYPDGFEAEKSLNRKEGDI